MVRIVVEGRPNDDAIRIDADRIAEGSIGNPDRREKLLARTPTRFQLDASERFASAGRRAARRRAHCARYNASPNRRA